MAMRDFSHSITLIIPTIPHREQMLERALASVKQQTRPPDITIVDHDEEGIGAAAIRNRSLVEVRTEWAAFLDDDDELLPDHFAGLLECASNNPHASLVYPWYRGINQRLFPWEPLGTEFTEEHANYIRTVGNFIPVTCLVRTAALKSVGGFSAKPGKPPSDPCEDWWTWVKMLDAGYRFVHHPEITWQWNGHAGHTSGRPWTMNTTSSAK